MIYSVLTVGLSDKLVAALQNLIIQYDLNFTTSLTTREANRLLERRVFHLLIIGLDYLRTIQQADWLTDIRHISFVPLIVLSDTPEQDINNMVQLGADMCISGKPPFAAIANHACAQLRRYTEYNHYNDPARTETSSFQMGDIFIDPARRIVKVCRRLVNLRPREFSLLLYFMRNPNIVLNSEQICEHAWGMEGSYNQGVSHPVRLLRQAIEPDPINPVYIKTVYRVGYCFTAYCVETYDMC